MGLELVLIERMFVLNCLNCYLNARIKGIKYLGFPSSEVFLSPNVCARRIQDSPLSPLEPGTARVYFLQCDLVDASEAVRLGIPDRWGLRQRNGFSNLQFVLLA